MAMMIMEANVTPMLIKVMTIRECPNAGNARPSRAEEHEEERKPCEDTG